MPLNFNEWLVNTKEKVSQISKEEVISKVQRATSKNKEENSDPFPAQLGAKLRFAISGQIYQIQVRTRKQK